MTISEYCKSKEGLLWTLADTEVVKDLERKMNQLAQECVQAAITGQTKESRADALRIAHECGVRCRVAWEEYSRIQREQAKIQNLACSYAWALEEIEKLQAKLVEAKRERASSSHLAPEFVARKSHAFVSRAGEYTECDLCGLNPSDSLHGPKEDFWDTLQNTPITGWEQVFGEEEVKSESGPPRDSPDSASSPDTSR